MVIFPQAVRILREYERAVVFRFGKLYGTKGPGLILLIPHGRSHGQNGPSGGDDRRRPTRANDSRKCPGNGRRRRLFPGGRSGSGNHSGGKLSESDVPHFANDLAQRPRTGRTR